VRVRIGQIEYANCTPIFTALKTNLDCSAYRFVSGVPSTLNAMLAAGEIDLCPSSSIEYGKSFEKYSLLPNLSISSIGVVKSVLLFSRVPIDDLANQPVGLTTESDTSINLLKIILAKKYGFRNRYLRTSLPLSEAIRQYSALLLIGDTALKASLANHGLYVYDLGELWHDFTGLPFVFALWIVRRDAAAVKHAEIKALCAELQQAKQLAYDSYESIASNSKEKSWINTEALVDYWRTISYDLTPAHIAGLQSFFHYAVQLGILTREPEISIFS
jgi:chorismate dehydratase